MPFNVLLLPLLGGYVFISCWNHTRFNARRYSGERLLFHAAIAGVSFLLVAFIITRSLIYLFPALFAWWRRLVPFAYTGTSFLAFVLGAVGWHPLNRRYERERESRRAVEQWSDFLEMLLGRAVIETKQVSITLSNGKVYVGFVTSNFDPAFDRKYITLLPTLSGYRDVATKSMIVTNDYAMIYVRLIEENSEFLIKLADQFQLVLPVAEVVSANLFDPKVYDLFRSARSSEAQESEIED